MRKGATIEAGLIIGLAVGSQVAPWGRVIFAAGLAGLAWSYWRHGADLSDAVTATVPDIEAHVEKLVESLSQTRAYTSDVLATAVEAVEELVKHDPFTAVRLVRGLADRTALYDEHTPLK